MIKSYNEAMDILQKLFSDTFMDLYNNISAKKKKVLDLYIQAIYRRWYYATLIDNTPLSPANIMDSVAEHFKISPKVYPVAVLKSSVEYNLIEYTLDNHPIINDLHIFIDSYNHFTKLQNDNSSPFDEKCEIATLLSIPDLDYVDFLFNIARSLELLEKVKSTPNFTTKQSSTSEEFFEQTNKEMLEEIIDAAVYICVKNIKAEFPPEINFFTENFLLNMLEEPKGVSDLLERAYESVGLSMSMFENNINSDYNPEEELDIGMLESMMMMTCTLGMAYDKFFITPFCTYLRLIKCLYLNSFLMEKEIRSFFIFNKEMETLYGFNSPCTVYHLTELGLEFFGYEKTEKNYLYMEESLSFESLDISIFRETNNVAHYIQLTKDIIGSISDEMEENEEVEETAYTIYKFKIVQSDNKKNWFHIGIDSYSSLHELYIEIVEQFPTSMIDVYSFYHDKEPNPFTEYFGPLNLRKSKKTSETMLKDMDFKHKKNMLLIYGRQSKPFSEEPLIYKLEILFMGEYDYGIQKISNLAEYPKIIRMGKGMKSVKKSY